MRVPGRVVVLLALAAASACRQRPEIRSPIEQAQVRSEAEWLRDPSVRLLRDYVRIDTVSRDGPGEREGALFLQRFFDCAGIETELVCPAPARCNLLARIPGRRRDGALLLVNHSDVVGVYPAYWREAPPFSGKIKNGYLYGRGSYDMKATALTEALAMRRLKESGIVPETDILFLAEADEEYEQRYGSAWLLEHRPEWFRGVASVINEGGMNEAVLRSLRFWGVDTVQAGYGSIEFEASATAPLARLASLTPRLDGPTVPPHPHVVASFDMIANHLPYPWSVDLRNLDAVRHDPAELRRMPDRYSSFLEPRIHWAEPYAFPPGQDREFRCYVIVATPPGVDPNPYLDRIVSSSATLPVKLRERISSGATTASPYPTDFTGLLERVTHAFYPGLPFGPLPLWGGITTSQLFRSRGFATYGYSPILMNITDEERRHGNDERIFLADYVRGVELMEQVVQEYAFFPASDKSSPLRPAM